MVFTERQAIRQRMEQISQERRELKEEYSNLLQRLRELDAKECEAVDTESVVGQLSQAVTSLSKLLPDIPTDVLLNHAANVIAQSGAQITNHSTEEETVEVASIEEIKHQQYIDYQKVITSKTTRKTTKRRINGLDDKIIEVLKENRTDMRLEELREEVQKMFVDEINEKTFFGRVNRLVAENPNVIKPGRGLYRYQI